MVTYKSPRIAKLVLLETNNDVEELIKIVESSSMDTTLSLGIDVKRFNAENFSNIIPFRMCR